MNTGLQSQTMVNDRFLILRQLGQGKLGRTYLAKDLNRFNPEFLTKSAIAKHRSLTGSGFEQSDRRFPQPTVCCQILS